MLKIAKKKKPEEDEDPKDKKSSKMPAPMAKYEEPAEELEELEEEDMFDGPEADEEDEPADAEPTEEAVAEDASKDDVEDSSEEPSGKGSESLVKQLIGLMGDLLNTSWQAKSSGLNVEGCMFPELHKFFLEYHDDVYESAGRFAESIRQHEAPVPGSFLDFMEAAKVPPAASIDSDCCALVQTLYENNMLVMESLREVSASAEKVGDLGLQNLAQQRMGAHMKWDWKLRVQLAKKPAAES